MKTNKALAINSILILISTPIINTILHELGHYIVASCFRLEPELHHNYVITHLSGTEKQQMLRAAAGPLFSLVFGILATYISIKCIKPSLLKLFTLWMGAGSLLMFMGYMMIAPIAKQGDTGKVFDYFGLPFYLSVIIAAISIFLITYIFGRLAKYFSYYKQDIEFNQHENKKQLFVYPITCSILAMTILSFPIMTPVSLLPAIFMPMAYFSIMGAYRRMSITDAPVPINRISIPLVLITVFCVTLFRYLAS
jgi:hypothetical protein